MRTLVLVLLLWAAAGCKASRARRGAQNEVPETGSSSAASPEDGRSRPSPLEAPRSARPPFDPPLGAYETGMPVKGRAVGHTSVVWKLTLSGDGGTVTCAFKPRSKRGALRYRGEIAAYRLAVALGLPNVPVAIGRDFSREAIRAVLDEDAKSLDATETVEIAGRVEGALLPWIPKLEILPLEAPEERTAWTAWLTTGAGLTTPSDENRAGQISTMILFDYLTANWDRWSGGNIGIDRATGTVLFLDNDGAFLTHPPPAALASSLALVRSLTRYSRSFVASLRALDTSKLDAIFGSAPGGDPLLSEAAIAAVRARRDTLLATIAEVTAKSGEAAALALP